MYADNSVNNFDGVVYHTTPSAPYDASGSYTYGPSGTYIPGYYVDSSGHSNFYPQLSAVAPLPTTTSSSTETTTTTPSYIYGTEPATEAGFNCLVKIPPLILAIFVFIICISLFPQTMDMIVNYNDQISCITKSNGRDPLCIVPYYLSPSELYENYTCGILTDDYYGTTCPAHYNCESFVNETLTDEHKSCGNYDLCKRFLGIDNIYYAACCNKWYPYEYDVIYNSYFCIYDGIIVNTANISTITNCTNMDINSIFKPINTELSQILNLLIVVCSIIIFVVSGTMSCVPVEKLKSSVKINVIFQVIIIFFLSILLIFSIIGYDIVFNASQYNECYSLINENIFHDLAHNLLIYIVPAITTFIIIWVFVIILSLCQCTEPNKKDYDDQ